jgi:predicted secreted protein
MKSLAAILLLAFSALSLAAAEKRVARTETSTLAIAFVDVAPAAGTLTAADNDAWLEVHALSHKPGSREAVTRMRRQVGVRIVRSGETAVGTARITARLESWDGRATVRIDGRTLTAAPLLVDAHAAVGAVAVHQLEIEVPVSVPAGPLAASIAWEVTTD